MSSETHPEMEQFIGLFEDMFNEPPDTAILSGRFQ